MIFFGTRTTHNLRKKVNRTCPTCGENGMLIDVFYQYFHIMWIPTFPIGKKVYAECSHCLRYLDERTMPEVIRQDARKARSESKKPLWLFSGLLILAGLFGSLIIFNFKENMNLSDYFEKPKPQDKYYIEEDAGQFSSFIVNQIDTDSLYVFWNSYYVDSSFDISTIDKTKNYVLETSGVSRVYLQAKFDSGQIIKIKR